MPANTPRGYPYPLPTEPVAEGAAAIRALAEAVDVGGMQLIETKKLSSAGVFDFQAIPQTFAHLKVIGSLRSSSAGANDNAALRFNGGSSAGYRYQQFLSAGATNYASEGAPTDKGRCAFCPAQASAPSPTLHGSLEILLPSYREPGILSAWQSSGFSMFGANLAAFQYTGFFWASGPVTSLQIFAEVAPGTFAAGSILSLYGLGAGAGYSVSLGRPGDELPDEIEPHE